jgi:glycosyltransferase involved in cell wall biosynthesis
VKIFLDLRWVRSATLDGLGRVSLCLVAELLRLNSPHSFGLLFSKRELAQFCMDWIRAYNSRPLRANYRTDILNCDAKSPLNRLFLQRLQTAFKADIYFTPYYPFHPVAGIPCVGMVHDLIPLLFPEYFRHASLPFRLLMTRATPLKHLLKACTKIITVSQSSAQDLQTRLAIPSEKIKVIPPGVQPFREHSSPAAVMHAYGLPGDGGFILTVGRPEPYKNFLGLLKIYARLPLVLREKHPLVLVGPEHALQTPQLQEEIASQGLENFVHLTGAVSTPDLPAFYQQAKVFVFPSLYEGFGLPVLEAMAAGLPVLCSNRASLPEAAGEAAVLWDPENLERGSRLLEKILIEPTLQAELIEKGQARAAKQTWKAMAEQVLALLETSA